MNPPAEFEQEQALFTRCLEHPPEAWEDVLTAHCDDAALRERVRQLLLHHVDTPSQDSGFLRLDGRDLDRVGPYRILRRLGEGGMGIVYAAEQREPVRRRVAVKVLRAGYNSREVLARFDVERQALALMSHPSIARILDAGTTADHRPYIVMEYVPGKAITQYCEQRALPLKERLLLFCDVCDAVQHAHQRGIIHRDLKPSNILIMEEDSRALPKVIDFGIAKATTVRLTDQTLETRIGSLLGTPDYMSPEQAELSPLDIDTRTDVYALGAVLYHLLTGRPPLTLAGSGKSYPEMQHAIRDHVPQPPSARLDGALQRQVRGELDWITLKALEKQRAQRYASPAEIASDIRRHLANETIIAGPPSRWRSVRKFTRRHWISVAATAAVMLTLAISQVQLIEKNRELQTERDRANTEAQAAAHMSTFLLDIFRASDPAGPDRGDVMARELLDRGRQRIEQDKALPPLQRQRLLAGLGNAYEHLGLHEKAVDLLREAVETATGEPLQRLHLLGRLAHAMQFTQRPAQTREVLQQALALAAENGITDLEDLFDVRRALTAIERELGSGEEARRQLEQLLLETRRHFGADDERTLDIGARLVHQLSVLAEYARAEALTLKLLPVATRALGEEHPITSYLRGNLANVYMALQRWEEAERIHREIHARFLEQFGPDAMPTQSATLGVAISTSDRQEGLRLLADLESRQRAQYGDDSPRLIITLQNTGWVHSRVPGHDAQAREYYDRAFVLATRHLGADHVALDSIHYGMAALAARAGDDASALAHLHEASASPSMLYRAAHDPDFDALRANPEFIRLLGRFADESSTFARDET